MKSGDRPGWMWEFNMVRRLRTPETVKKRIDMMLRSTEVITLWNLLAPHILDHGVGAYEFDHYDYEEASWSNNYTSALDVYYKDFDEAKTPRLYMRLTENNLRKPGKDDCGEFVDCYWEKEYPTLLYMREYDSWR